MGWRTIGVLAVVTLSACSDGGEALPAEPPPECGSEVDFFGLPARAHLGADEQIDWIVETGVIGTSDLANYRVCDSEADEPWAFEATRLHEGIITIDIDRDGIDDLFLFGGTWATGVPSEVFVRPPGLDTLVPLVDPEGRLVDLSSTAWVPESGEASSRWYGCGDLDGDGRRGVARGTYVVEGDTVTWKGDELTIEDGRVNASAPVAGTERFDEDDPWSTPGDFCVSAETARSSPAPPENLWPLAVFDFMDWDAQPGWELQEAVYPLEGGWPGPLMETVEWFNEYDRLVDIGNGVRQGFYLTVAGHSAGFDDFRMRSIYEDLVAIESINDRESLAWVSTEGEGYVTIMLKINEEFTVAVGAGAMALDEVREIAGRVRLVDADDWVANGGRFIECVWLTPGCSAIPPKYQPTTTTTRPTPELSTTTLDPG